MNENNITRKQSKQKAVYVTFLQYLICLISLKLAQQLFLKLFWNNGQVKEFPIKEDSTESAVNNSLPSPLLVLSGAYVKFSFFFCPRLSFIKEQTGFFKKVLFIRTWSKSELDLKPVLLVFYLKDVV